MFKKIVENNLDLKIFKFIKEDTYKEKQKNSKSSPYLESMIKMMKKS